MTATKEYMRPGEVAQLLRVSSKTVWSIPATELPFTRTPGGQRRYATVDVKSYQTRINQPEAS